MISSMKDGVQAKFANEVVPQEFLFYSLKALVSRNIQSTGCLENGGLEGVNVNAEEGREIFQLRTGARRKRPLVERNAYRRLAGRRHC